MTIADGPEPTRAMRILLAADKFKGSLSAQEVNNALRSGLLMAAADLDVTTVPVADGGDGTLDAAVHAGYRRVHTDAAGPTGRPRVAAYGRLGDTALVELAGVCGLMLLGTKRDPLGATSFGVGLALRAALDAGAMRVVVGIGGSASTDGGAGMLAALGGRLYDAHGQELALGGGALADLDRIELATLHPRLAEIELVVASDVDNPLCGPNGAAAVYGPQKGASAAQIGLLDVNLWHFATLVARATGIDHGDEPGAGAAGGVGFGALVIGARLRAGIDVVLDLVQFESALDGVDLVITGEGSLDEQTLAGKAPAGVAAAARRRGIPVVAVAGRVALSAAQLAAAGIERAYALSDLEPDVTRSMTAAAALLERVGLAIGAEL